MVRDRHRYAELSRISGLDDRQRRARGFVSPSCRRRAVRASPGVGLLSRPSKCGRSSAFVICFRAIAASHGSAAAARYKSAPKKAAITSLRKHEPRHAIRTERFDHCRFVAAARGGGGFSPITVWTQPRTRDSSTPPSADHELAAGRCPLASRRARPSAQQCDRAEERPRTARAGLVLLLLECSCAMGIPIDRQRQPVIRRRPF